MKIEVGKEYQCLGGMKAIVQAEGTLEGIKYYEVKYIDPDGRYTIKDVNPSGTVLWEPLTNKYNLILSKEDKEPEQEWFLEVGKRYLDTGGTEWRCVGFSAFVPNIGDQIAVMEAWRSNEIKRFFVNGNSEDWMHRIYAEVTLWGKTPVLDDELVKMLEEDDA